ncbi:DUF2931 family protein [Stutzerimonas stutzeri]|uniref:DUF2931 family protein n=1 Tax=Stutzerimonas stutzeri TaxID=316 RepID=A0A6I6LIX9_STUST|nr:DUF2931 family protein [Stutzerimonas stutzeri]QGZ29223.1 DUF2931 family protein [Stutzerimonas stutzeri]
MPRFRWIRPWLLVLCLSGCAKGSELPYEDVPAWYLGFLAPNYMEVWIETADAVDVNDRVFRRAMSGVSAIQTPPNLAGDPRGWPERPGGGAGKHVFGAALPRLIYVRWQSLAEPQTYQAYIVIPEAIQKEMVKGEKGYCAATGRWKTDYRNMLTIGLAPGGITKTWLMGPCLEPIEVARVEGEVVKRGPSQGLTDGRYALPLEPESKAYIEKYGIPYDSW